LATSRPPSASSDNSPEFGTDAPGRFAEEARVAGLVLPSPHRASPWLSITIIVVVIGSAVGIGAFTGWTDLKVPTVQTIPLYGAQNCGPTPLDLPGTVAAGLGTSFVSWLSNDGTQITNQTGGCVHLDVSSSAGDGFVPELSGLRVDFVAASGPPSPSEAAALPSLVSVYPVALNPVAVAYNLPGVETGLRLNGSILAGIYSGVIRSWDSPEIAGLNPSTDLADAPVMTVLYESTPNPSNAVFTQFLADSSPSWNTTVGAGPTVAWPAGTAVNSSEELLDRLASTPGTIGYVELFNGSAGPSQVAQLANSAETFTSPNVTGTEAAAASDAGLASVVARDWSNVSLVNAPGNQSYPLDQLSYIGVYHNLSAAYGGSLTRTNASWLMTFLWWISESTAFAPLPVPFFLAAVQTLTNVTYDGTPILQVQDPEGGENGGETGEF
jgi:phosphate transport system substrate-binding protein